MKVALTSNRIGEAKENKIHERKKMKRRNYVAKYFLSIKRKCECIHGMYVT